MDSIPPSIAKYQFLRTFVVAIGAALLTEAPANSQTLDQQERCSLQAKKYFQESSAEWNQGVEKSAPPKQTLISVDYESHYNTKLGKCLVLLNRMSSVTFGDNVTFSVTIELSDAFERHIYAYYLWMTRKGKKYWEVPPMTCELTPTLAEKQLCENREQFDALVTPFMTQ